MSSDTHYTLELPENDGFEFQVVSFKGYEALSKPFNFNFELYSENSDLNVRQLLGKKVNFTLEVLGKSRKIHGRVAYCRILHPIENGYLYQLQMVPRLARLEMIQTNEIYLDETLVETLEKVLEEGEFTSEDYDLSKLGEYRSWDFRCQFGESHLNFLHRITEREGIYYRFHQLEDKEKVVFYDASSQHLTDSVATLYYLPETGRVPTAETSFLTQWISHGEPLPKTIALKDYNSNTPSSQIEGQATIDEQGFGSIYRYCDNLINSDEAEKIAEVRAEELKMKSEVFHGESRDITLETGLIFSVEGHFRINDNGEFYPFILEHQGFNSAFQRFNDASTSQAPYKNRIQALRTNLQFRPSVTTEKPRFFGVLNAIIDTNSDDGYANLDTEGRYKVILPFDRERSAGEGKASCWIPMMQPSAGKGGGMHFPLLAGTEVLLSFIGGDPDRPIISGALPNAAYPSVVKDANKTSSLLRSASGNRIELEDEEGSSRLKLFSPTNNTYLHLGAPNHSGDGFTLTSDGLYRYEMLGGKQTLVFARSHSVDDKNSDAFTVKKHGGEDGDTFDEQALFAFPKLDSGDYGDSSLTKKEELSGNYLISRKAGHQYNWEDGDVYNFSGDGSEFNFGGGDETLTFFVEPSDTRYKKMKWDVPKKLKGAKEWAFDDSVKGKDTAWSADNHYIEKLWGNTFNYQMGNNYTWGDTADYDFGNGYEEVHIDESVAGGINQKLDNDKVDTGGPYLSSITGNNITYAEPGDILIEKTYGDTYEYRNGKMLEVHVGEAEEHHHGTSWSYKHGDSYEETYGLTKSTHHGRAEDYFMGGTFEASFAATKSINLSATSDITVGVANEIYLGATNGIALALANEMFFGVRMDISFSSTTEIALGFKNELNAVVETNMSGTKLEQNITEIKNKLSSVDNLLNKVNNSTVNIGNTAATKISSAILTLIN
ncbi:type VI secretion system Vgr family protein [Marinospirillum minutulum]|uniref:type VI secretion system Vgr family protein n=1 Tax=Marinospirillum minutulum TaxID=64974 RepID=UPI0003FF84DC|nr:type VI secretion system tip protein TssI/VgrG [Marinospirillum minutulum]